MVSTTRLAAAYERAKADLLSERVAAGHWIGELATSSLSTATAVSALTLVSKGEKAHGGDEGRQAQFTQFIDNGVHYLTTHQNPDGGWGDTDKSFSNISTTMLVVAALHLVGRESEFKSLLDKAQAYIDERGGVVGLRRRYGKDKTFAVPILTNCALAGLVPWSEVSPLPFELACLPQKFYRFVKLPVVSYAIPALVAIGQARFFHRPPWNPLMRALRAASVKRSLQVLRHMQPASGGYLEAVPLTSFVVMSLAATGRAMHEVTKSGVQFLLDSVRPDGSWPIDTNLATWTTTLSINALSGDRSLSSGQAELLNPRHLSIAGHREEENLNPAEISGGGDSVFTKPLLDWLLNCQHRKRHPFTGADPGGWGWSDLSGAVPDADDTPGALLALFHLRRATGYSEEDRRRIVEAARQGLQWLIGLQNRDGGWPTFCRGWGTLPFDRSGADLTAHAIRAIYAWRELESEPSLRGMLAAMERGFVYLRRQQRADGSWLPLWFGNQSYREDENPVYGTAKVLAAFRDTGRMQTAEARRGVTWLLGDQNHDGGWGNAAGIGSEKVEEVRSSVEETALACEALLPAMAETTPQAAISQGLDWLIRTVETRQHRECSPIGFYFAKLWYYERLYPLTFTVSALSQSLRTLAETSPRQTATSPNEDGPSEAGTWPILPTV